MYFKAFYPSKNRNIFISSTITIVIMNIFGCDLSRVLYELIYHVWFRIELHVK